MDTVVVLVENRPFFGALLVHVPLLHALRARHAGARLVLLAPFPQAALLVELGAADAVERYAGALDAAARLRALAPVAVYSLRPASRGLDLAVAATGARERVGFASWLAPVAFTRALPHDTTIYRARKYLTLVEPREQALAAPLGTHFRARLGAAAPAARTRLLVLLPGGGAGAWKLWGIENFLALAKRLAADDAALRFAWVIGPQEAALRERLAASPLARRSDVLESRPVDELAALALRAAAAVGNDCGPAHVVQMCGCPFACVVSDHDGRGRVMADEWLDTANRPLATIGAPGEPIARVPVDAVRERAAGLLGL